jgi:hypothetical protein
MAHGCLAFVSRVGAVTARKRLTAQASSNEPITAGAHSLPLPCSWMRPPVFDDGIVETRRVMDSGRIMVLDGRWDAAARRLLRCVTRRAAYSVKHRNRGSQRCRNRPRHERLPLSTSPPVGHRAVAKHDHALALCQAIHERESWQAHEREGRVGHLSGSAFGKFDDPIDYSLQFGVSHRAATW